MKTKSIAWVLSISLVAFACQEEKGLDKKVKISKEIAEVPVEVNTVMELDVEGMTCEMGCGGSIRKALKDTKSVNQVSFVEFDADKDANKAVIRFDRNKITADKIVNLIQEINENQFTVSNVKTETVDVAASSSVQEDAKTSTSEKSKVNMEVSSVELPNLFEIFTGFLR